MLIAQNVLAIIVLSVIAIAAYLVNYWKGRALKLEQKNQKELVDAVLKESEQKIMSSDINDLVKLGNKLYGKSRRNPDDSKE
jgi:hypothetical protein